MSNTIQCPKCEEYVPAGHKFCPECGFKLVSAANTMTKKAPEKSTYKKTSKMANDEDIEDEEYDDDDIEDEDIDDDDDEDEEEYDDDECDDDEDDDDYDDDDDDDDDEDDDDEDDEDEEYEDEDDEEIEPPAPSRKKVLSPTSAVAPKIKAEVPSKQPIRKQQVPPSYDPNHDHYYDDVLPEIMDEINRFPIEVLLKIGLGVSVIVGAILYCVYYVTV